MAQEETQTEEVQAPEMTDDELWESTLNEEKATLEQEAEEVQEAEIVQEPQAEAEEIQAEAEVEPEPEHDWQKRYKDLEKDYHKRNEDTASFRRESDARVSDLEKQIQQMRIERLELENNFKNLVLESTIQKDYI